MIQKLHMSLIFSNLVASNIKLYNQIMCNLYAKYVKILEICKQFSENLVNDKGNVRRFPLYSVDFSPKICTSVYS